MHWIFEQGVFEKNGLTQRQMQDCDALLFCQLLIRICNPEKSVFRDDPCKMFYNVASKCTIKYANVDKECGTNYGHPFRPANAAELINFDGILF